MAEPGARNSSLYGGRRVLVAGSFALFALLASGAWGAVGSHAAGAQRPVHPPAHVRTTRRSVVQHGPQHRAPRPRSRTIHVPSGAAVKRFDVSEPTGTVRLLRVTVPDETRARIIGTIPHVAGISIFTPRQRHDPSETCQRRGGTDVCTQGEEACPMPPATWHFRLNKLAGPAGEIRLDFAVG